MHMYCYNLSGSMFLCCRDESKYIESKPVGTKRPAYTHMDYNDLLQHFDRVQSKHLEVRHQRSGRADHPDRKLVL